MRNQNKTPKVKEDTSAHERLGLRVDDKNDEHVDLDENGAIQEKDRQNVWT
jgi:hypothetical protein